jgi:tellurite resistance protein TerC
MAKMHGEISAASVAGHIRVPLWFWGAFFAFVIVMLVLDLFVLNRKTHIIKVREALMQTAMWVALALLFNLGLYYLRGSTKALEFLTAYLVEYSLSVDNLFVFLLIFNFFHVPKSYEHKVLFWGILGALIMRIAFILAGVTLITKLHWVIYIFGGFLVFIGIRMLFQKEEAVDPSKNPVLRLAKKILPTTHEFDHGNFFTLHNGRRLATPLFIAVLVIETTDVVFALDSIPAVLSITQDAFIAYTSNVFAILGLRSLFFALSGIMEMFHYLKYGLSLILIFIGAKMLVASFIPIPTGIALAVVAGILAISVVGSIIRMKRREKETALPPDSVT